MITHLDDYRNYPARDAGVTIHLHSCEWDTGRFEESIRVLQQAVRDVDDLGYVCDVTYEPPIGEDGEPMDWPGDA